MTTEAVLRLAEAGDAPLMQSLAISSYEKYVPRMGRAPFFSKILH
jgi:hypothetical protein